MALYVAHSLIRVKGSHFSSCASSMTHKVQCIKLAALCTSRSQAQFVHLQRCPLLFQVLRNPSFLFSSPLSLKFKTDFYLWNSVQLRVNFTSKPHDDKSANRPLNFMDSDRCMLFDSDDAHVTHVTFSEARILANKKKCRLVYMHTNRDGVFCFKLQTFTDAMNNLMLDSTSTNTPKFKPVEKSQKSSPKEFKIQASITDHDLAIKLKKMRALLVKGKLLMLLISNPETSKDNKATVIVKKLTEDLEDICKVKMEVTKNTTRLTLMPKEKVEHEIK